MALPFLPWVPLVGLHQDEDVVHTDGKHEEGNDLEDDEGCRDANEAEGSDTGGYREENNHHSAKTERDLALDHEPGHCALARLAKTERDVDKHDDVGDRDGDNISIGLLVKLVLNGSLGIVGHLHEGRLLLLLPLVHELHEDFLPGHRPLQPPHVLRLLRVLVVVVDDQGHNDSVGYVVLRRRREWLSLGDEPTEGVVRLYRTTPFAHAADSKLVAGPCQSWVVCTRQEVVEVRPRSLSVAVPAFGVDLLHVQELFVVLPIGEHVLDVALLDLRAERHVTHLLQVISLHRAVALCVIKRKSLDLFLQFQNLLQELFLENRTKLHVLT